MLLAVRMLAFDFDVSGWLVVGFAYASAFATTFVVLVLVGLVRLALRAGGRIDRAHIGLGTAATALCAGLLAWLPVHAEWSDGCNTHTGDVPVLLVPYIALVSPEHSPPYDVMETLRACVRLGPGASPRLDP